MSMTHHNQTKVLTPWFLNLFFDEFIDNTKAQSLNLESKTTRKAANQGKAQSKPQNQKTQNSL
jgi:hypothetical protein